MKKQISVIGCGWLGLPLSKYLITKSYKIKGSTTSKDKLKTLRESSIEGFIVSLNEDNISGDYSEFLTGSETVIINIPPGLRINPDKNHVSEIEHLVNVIEEKRVKNILYISSTSVFKDEEELPIIGNDTQPNANSNSAKQLIEIERMLQESSNFNTTILRFGGLFDEHRHAAKYLSGKNNVSNPYAPINLIHKHDCIEIIFQILKNNYWNATLNAVYPYHPKKEKYYSNYCEKYNLELPNFNYKEKSKGKIIDSSKLVQLLNYTFKQAL